MTFVARVLIVVGIATLASACVVAPTVQYTKIPKPEEVKGDEIDTFFLQSSIIMIDKVGTKRDTEGKEVDDLSWA